MVAKTITGALAAGLILALGGCGAARPAPVYDVSVGAKSTSNLGPDDYSRAIPTSLRNINPSTQAPAIATQLADDLTDPGSGPQAVEGQATCEPANSLVYNCDVGDGTILTVRLTPDTETP